MAAFHDEKTNPRPEPAKDNWEALALSRVARRVEELPDDPAAADDFGWERDVLAQLRRRLAQGE